jgi:peptidoglycan/LPS O-acetylase OafA/YrhL
VYSLADAFDSKRNNFNFLRLFLAVAVIYSHAAFLLYGPPTLDAVGTFLHDQFDEPRDHAIDSGHLAVYGFFVISGFLISMSWRRSENAWSYFRKRVLRIYPGFIGAMLVGLFVLGPLGASEVGAYFGGLWWSLVAWVPRMLCLSAPWDVAPFTETLKGVPIAHVLNGSLWTIRPEFLCYVMVAVLGGASLLVPGRWRMKVMVVGPVLLFLFLYGVYLGRLHGWLDHPFPWLEASERGRKVLERVWELPRLFTYFAAGMCLYAYRRSIPVSRWLVAGAVVVIVGSIFVPGVLAVTLPICGSYALLCFSTVKQPWMNGFGKSTDLSYGVYLYAFPLQQLAVMYFGPHLTAMTAFLAVLPPVFLLAWLSWTLVERPAMRWRPAGKGARAPREVAAAAAE